MGDIYEARQVRVGYAEQATWGTRIIDGARFTEIACETVEVDRDIKRHDTTTQSGSRQGVYANVIHNTNGSMPKFAVRGPFSLYEGDSMIYAFLQGVTEEDATPYKKTLFPAASQPDFSSSDDLFLTFLHRMPVASTSIALKDCISNSLKLECERGGYLTYESGFVARGAAELDANPSGTWERGLDEPGGSDASASNYGMLFFEDIDAVTIAIAGGGAVTPVLKSFKIDMSQEVEAVGPDGSGSFANYGLHSFTGTLEMVMLKDSTAEALFAAHEDPDGNYVSVVIRWGSAGAAVNGELQITMTGKVTGMTNIQDGLLESTMTVELLAAAAGSNSIQILMSNAIDRVWTGTA